MKKFQILSAAILTFGMSVLADAQMANWQQQKDFHSVMSATWHPAEKGDLQPVKMRSMEMVSKAQAWKNAAIPSAIEDKKAVRRNLRYLVKDARLLNRKVKSGASDAELIKQLEKTHNTYHTLVGLCKDTEKHDHEDHTGHNH